MTDEAIFTFHVDVSLLFTYMFVEWEVPLRNAGVSLSLN